LNQHYTYFLILAAAFAGPLLLSFDKKVAFYKQWKYLFPAMIIPAVIYIAWDSWFTSMNVWSFNDQFIIGKKYAGLPIEEILFFFIVPYCCVFIYECIRVYFPVLSAKDHGDKILKLLAVFLVILGILHWEKAYTASTALFLGFVLILFFLFKKYIASFNRGLFLISYAITLVPFMVVNGFLTALPVVIYNDAENLSLRISSIPVEDIFYGMLLVFLNILLFEQLRRKR
jgi:lycopene cyclase domain-containing protein